jgi:hypothetical protein
MSWDEIFAYVQANPDKTRGIWDRLSDEERQEYMAAAERWVQAQGNREGQREDNTLLGGPPELAAAGVAGLARGGMRQILDKVLGRKRFSGQNPLTNEIDPSIAGKPYRPSKPAAPRASSPERAEFPPGTSRRTPPDAFKAKQAEHAERVYNDPALQNKVRPKVQEALDKKPVQRRKK